MNRICTLLDVHYPIIQAGMVWCSGWKLADAVSKAGGFGIIGAGSMYPNILEDHIKQFRQNNSGTFAVNLPQFNKYAAEHIEVIIRNQVPVVFTSAGNPNQYTSLLKSHNIKVIHVVSSLKFALKAQEAGVDAVVAEGFEAGGHNGREESTTLCLLEFLYGQLSIPVIAAGGIATGRAMVAAMALGAEGVQVGSRFANCAESSAHVNFKRAVQEAGEGATDLTLKELTPVRLIKNDFHKQIIAAYNQGASLEELQNLLGRGRSRMGIFEGNLVDGELEIGQIAGIINKNETAAEIIEDIWQVYQNTITSLKG